MMVKRTLAVVITATIVCVLLLPRYSGRSIEVHAQDATPIPIQIASPTPLPQLGDVPTATTTSTPTPVGPVLLEVGVEGSVNVRAQADPDSAILGTIGSGQQYAVVGRYFRWIQFRYDLSPTGTGWVFDELVTIVGDETLIPDLTEELNTDVDELAVQATQTWEVLVQTPGAELTATAGGRIIDEAIPVDENGDEIIIDPTGIRTPLPTFTPPPNLQVLTATPVNNPDVDVVASSDGGLANGVPPIVPIALLGGIGIFGLMISLLRR